MHPQDKPSPSETKRFPTATYRLQFTMDFTLSDATSLLNYLAKLGISDIYASPLFTATLTSTHGYDVCDHSQIHGPIGNREDLDRLSAELDQRGMGLMLDIVPNHMAADTSNCWWADVLENGLNSDYANYFDIDWEGLSSASQGKVLLPILGHHYANELESGNLKLVYEDGAFFVGYYDKRFPVAARSFSRLLRGLAERMAKDARSKETASLVSLAEEVDRCLSAKPIASAELSRIKRYFADRHQHSAAIQQVVEKLVSEFSSNDVRELIQEQHYRLGYWRTAQDELNYRRFFDVAGLVCLRVELPEVFERSHKFLISLIRERIVTGVRIDHPDGLWDPCQYFDHLHHAMMDFECYTVAEKILSGDEVLLSDWHADGTTGYDFMNLLNGLFIDREHRASLEHTYRDFTGSVQAFDDVLYESKRQVLAELFYSNLQSLSRRLHCIAMASMFGQDFSFRYLTDALSDVIACFPVYRTYITERTDKVSNVDRKAIHTAASEATRRGKSGLAAGVAFISRLLLLDPPAGLDPAMAGDCRQFAMRFQQLTGPVMAKGLEDTALYRYSAFLSLNEVGGNPNRFGVTVDEFHSRNKRQVRDWPHSLLATSTHDTKRGEDIRARLNVLSEIPDEWRRVVSQWSALNAHKKTMIDGQPAPSANDEYLFYQTLIGAWPSDGLQEAAIADLCQRLKGYMLKAVKEAKLLTGWTQPNAAYESAVVRFVEAVVNPSTDNHFWKEFIAWFPQIAFYGALNSLSQTLLKLTCPGVPDFYQGTELWDLTLVDPDNRRPVDFNRRRQNLDALEARSRPSSGKLLATELLDRINTGEVKMFLIWRALQFRNTHPDLFEHGDYQPVALRGTQQRHVCAFARTFGNQKLLVIAPRLFATLTQRKIQLPLGPATWDDTAVEIPSDWRVQHWHNVLTDERCTSHIHTTTILLGELLLNFPVALISSSDT